MDRTRISLLYVVAYLWIGGLGLLAAPQWAARLLLVLVGIVGLGLLLTGWAYLSDRRAS